MSRLFALATLVAVAGLQFAVEPAFATTQTFTNTTPFAIPAPGDDQGPASLYPSPVVVNGMTGPITDVNIVLHRFGHTGPWDLDVLLVSPSGDHVLVMGAVCGTADVEDFTWVFDQQALSDMPRAGPCDGFVYRPSTSRPGILPPPAPVGPHGASFDAFNGEQANGTWSLYATDHGVGDVGDLEGGWSLTVTTGAVDTAVPATGTFGAAGPYPSIRTVSGVAGVITDVDVSIDGVWHQRPDDLDLLLVGPRGQKVVLMSDACGTFEVAGRGWEWDDEAPAPMTDSDAFSTCGTRAHRPTDYEPGDSWPAPAPAGPYGATLSALDLTDPNGDWRLFVHDDAIDRVGFFTTRFALEFATRPAATVAFTETAVQVGEGAARNLTLVRSAAGPLGAGAVTVTSVPASATSGSDFTPVSTVIQFAAGQRTAIVPVRVLADAEQEPDEVFALAIGAPAGDAATGMRSSVSVTIPGFTTGPGGGGQPPPPPPPPPPSPPAPPPPPPARARCAGQRATIVGTAGRDRIRGTRRRDVIAALGGDDAIHGLAGNDLVCAGPGRDTVLGGRGGDTLRGEAGADRLIGGPGRDRLLGGPGRDVETQ